MVRHGQLHRCRRVGRTSHTQFCGGSETCSPPLGRERDLESSWIDPRADDRHRLLGGIALCQHPGDAIGRSAPPAGLAALRRGVQLALASRTAKPKEGVVESGEGRWQHWRHTRRKGGRGRPKRPSSLVRLLPILTTIQARRAPVAKGLAARSDRRTVPGTPYSTLADWASRVAPISWPHRFRPKTWTLNLSPEQFTFAAESPLRSP